MPTPEVRRGDGAEGIRRRREGAEVMRRRGDGSTGFITRGVGAGAGCITRQAGMCCGSE
jgi:hypothetical protein